MVKRIEAAHIWRLAAPVPFWLNHRGVNTNYAIFIIPICVCCMVRWMVSRLLLLTLLLLWLLFLPTAQGSAAKASAPVVGTRPVFTARLLRGQPRRVSEPQRIVRRICIPIPRLRGCGAGARLQRIDGGEASLRAGEVAGLREV